MWKPEWTSVGEAIARLPESEVQSGPEPACAVCGDIGMIVDGPKRRAIRCACVAERVTAKRIARCGIPRRYADASFATFRSAGLDPSVAWALRMARGVVEQYPLGGDGRGLLLTGTCGVGKTHLAAALLVALAAERGASGRFWDVGDLLIQLKRSFQPVAGGAEGEGALFEEVKTVDVLVLDELGAQRQTEWSYDEVSLLLGARYNAARLTVITTNYANLGPGEGALINGVRAETLGDRVGARIHSRLQEMCRPVAMIGADWRRSRACERAPTGVPQNV